ncbi:MULTISPECIES: cytochrome P450 [Nocardia]|uniref:cytochrome P450 n=1 Tax=Nocardia TaxID=1817 RepID=UPI0002EAAF23|nr:MULTISPECIES: cytochrome P450 [Nocardia]
MTAPTQARCPFGPGAAVDGEERVSLYSEEFAADPLAAYREMRAQYGSLVPVWLAPGVAATLVVGYRTALRVMHDEEHFPAAPSRWEETADPSSSVFEVLRGRRNGLRTAGPDHKRYRGAINDALTGIDRFRVERIIDDHAQLLINTFCEVGRADLRGQYAYPLTFWVMCGLLGLAPEDAHSAWAQMAAMLDGDAEAGPRFGEALYKAVQAKRAAPGDDVISRLIEHPAGLDDVEVVEQTALLLGPGTEPTCNLITNAVLLTLRDERFGGDVHGGSLSVRDAIAEVLFTDTPLPNFGATYPPQPLLIEDVWLPAHQPVLISYAACNTDPAVDQQGIDRDGNHSHLSWGAGAHACPTRARDIAGIIVARAVELLIDAIPDLTFAAEAPTWRPGPFHRALAALPVTFQPCPPMNLAMPPMHPKENSR